jgi:hypothetical protein
MFIYLSINECVLMEASERIVMKFGMGGGSTPLVVKQM